jgi:hypothetical protein
MEPGESTRRTHRRQEASPAQQVPGHTAIDLPRLPGNTGDGPRIPRGSRKIASAVTAPALPPSPEERYRLLLRIAESVNERLELAPALGAACLCVEPHGIPLLLLFQRRSGGGPVEVAMH